MIVVGLTGAFLRGCVEGFVVLLGPVSLLVVLVGMIPA